MALQTGLLHMMLQELLTNSVNYPSNQTEIAMRWSSLIDSYASLVTPLSLNSASAKSAMFGVLMSNPVSGSLLIMLPLAIATYATQLAIGMQPTFTGTPPILPLNLLPAYTIGTSGGTSLAVATSMSTIIDLWFRTGLAINNSTAATIPWI